MFDTADWRGQSGKTYSYQVHDLNQRPTADEEGNYIFAKCVDYVDYAWKAVYVGQGNLQDRYDAAIKEGCVTRKGATHYHSHPNSNTDSRQEEEQDIIKGNPECQWPDGCNGHD